MLQPSKFESPVFTSSCFRDDQMAGVFALVSDDWSFVEPIATAQPALSSRKAGRPVRALLELRRSLHTAQRHGTALYLSRNHTLD